jgi:cobalamin biosynthesis protein CobD/CbiB
MVVIHFYHIIINFIIPGYLSFKQGKYRKGTLLLFLFFAGIDTILLGCTGFIATAIAVPAGIALALFAWGYSQWGCFRGFLRSSSDESQKSIQYIYRSGIESLVKDDLDAARLACKNCRKRDPFSASAFLLSGVVESELCRKGVQKRGGEAFLEAAHDMARSENWRWFIERIQRNG